MEIRYRDTVYFAASYRRGGRAAECTGLENRQGLTPLVGSNPTPSAITLASRHGEAERIRKDQKPEHSPPVDNQIRRSVRVAEGARLESVYTLTAYRGFESLLLRQP